MRSMQKRSYILGNGKEYSYSHFPKSEGRPRVDREVPDAAKPLSISVLG